MLSRRSWLVASTAAVLTSACSSIGFVYPKTSLADYLRFLSSIEDETALTERFGPANYELTFNHDVPNGDQFIHRLSRAEWKAGRVSVPPNLIDELPVGTRMRNVPFIQSTDINPAMFLLVVFIDDSGRIVGWMYDDYLQGREANFSRRPQSKSKGAATCD